MKSKLKFKVQSNKKRRSVRRVSTKSASGSVRKQLPKRGRNLHFRSLHQAWRQFHEGSLSHWIATMVIALSLTIYGLFALLFANVNTWMALWHAENRMTIFLMADLSSEEIVSLNKRLSDRFERISATVYAVSPETALQRLQEMLGADGDLLMVELQHNPMPYSFEILLDETQQSTKKVLNLAREIQRWSGVESVSYDRQWLERLQSLVETVQYAGSVFSALLMIAVALIVSNTIKLTIIARKEEIEIMRFMGATDAFIKTPFLYEGLFQGLLGAGLGLLLITLIHQGARQAFLKLSVSFGFLMDFHHLPLFQIFLIVTMGMALGLMGALISVTRFLKV